MPLNILETAFSRTKKLVKRVVKKHNDAIKLIETMPHTWYDEIGNIRAVVDDFEHELKGVIPSIKGQLRGQPARERYRFNSEDMDYYPPLVISLDPSFREHLASLGRGLCPIVAHLRQWPFDNLETILLDLEQLLMEAVPCLRAALTRVELNEQDFRRLYGNVEPNAHAFNSPAIGQAPKEAIRKWLQGFPEKMRHVRRLPPYFPDDDGRDSSYISSSDADSFSTSSSDRESFDSSSSGGSRSDNSGYAGDHEGAGGTRVFIDLTGLDDEGVNLEDGRDFNDLAREDSVMDTGEGVIDLTQDDDEGEDENMDSPGPIILSDLGLDD